MYLKKKKKNAEISWKRNHRVFFLFFFFFRFQRRYYCGRRSLRDTLLETMARIFKCVARVPDVVPESREKCQPRGRRIAPRATTAIGATLIPPRA